MDNENNENSSLLDDDEPTLDLDLNVLQQLAESFWKKIKATNKLHGGRLFDKNGVSLIQQNGALIDYKYAEIVDKLLLFWS